MNNEKKKKNKKKKKNERKDFNSYLYIFFLLIFINIYIKKNYKTLKKKIIYNQYNLIYK